MKVASKIIYHQQHSAQIDDLVTSPTPTPTPQLASNDSMALLSDNEPKYCAKETKFCDRDQKKVIGPAKFKPPAPPSALTSYVVHLVISVIFLLSATVLNTYQQSVYCPKSCTCSDQTLAIHCTESLDKGLSGIPLTLNPNAQWLTINNAQTSQLSGVDSMINLQILDLAHNKLALIDFSDITRNQNLNSFNSSHNSISELKDSIVTNSLLEFDITTHNFDNYDERIESELRRKLTKISVVEFDLSHNSLTIIRNLTFVRWSKLQHLDLSYNQLSILENHSLFGLTSLERINLRSNHLVQLPSIALSDLTRSVFNKMRPNPTDQSPLKHLDLSENPFQYIGSGAFNMVGKAEDIDLDSCSIQSISDRAFEGLRFLQNLSLDKNFLQKIPSQSFADLDSLRVLTLNENNISSIETNSFSDLVKLQKLELGGGSFKQLEAGTFNGLKNLRTLKISHNPNLMIVRPGTFDNLASLSLLNLQSNSLPYIPADVSHGSPIIIDLRNNPLECGCDLRWLTGWLRKFNETLQLDARTIQTIYANESTHDPSQILNLTCSWPPALIGQTVMDLPISKLECLEPSSELNVLVGYAALFAISTILIVVCMANFIQNKKQLLTLLKENLVQSHMPTVSPYTLNLHNNIDNIKKETQLYNSDYENIDYGPQAQIYSVQGDQIMYYGPQQQQQQYSQQI